MVRRHLIRLAAAGACALIVLDGPALAAAGKGVRFVNLTGQTLREVSLSPAGEQDYGPNECINGAGGTVAADAELAIRGVPPGRYDVRVTDASGRVCFARSVDVQNHAAFSIAAKDLVDCAP